MLISNPPYIASDQIQNLDTELSYEPVCALDGGRHGIEAYSLLLSQLSLLPSLPSIVALEIGDHQGVVLTRLFQTQIPSYSVEVMADLAHKERFLFAESKITKKVE